jgi:hypothetical protein
MDSAARPDLLADGYILRRGLLQDFALNLFFGIAFLNLNARFKRGVWNRHFFWNTHSRVLLVLIP